MKTYKHIDVYYQDRLVGRMAKIKDEERFAFQYSKEWLSSGFSISPFSLPLKEGVFVPEMNNYFDGLFGVFSDSLPDGWGRLLVDRMLIKNNISPNSIDGLNRLGIVGDYGMGALTYRPVFELMNEIEEMEYDKLAVECKKILEDKSSDDLDTLFKYGGSSGGARPKILTKVDGEDWIVKFASSIDDKNIGKQEYDYSLCAKACGIEMPETRLFPSKLNKGYFGVKRFDRYVENGIVKKVHMISAAALLETTHRIPNLDYNILMKLALKLTTDFNEVEKMFRLMCFNVFAHNRDDHAKNFSFIYDEEAKKYRVSPAYDLTFSSSINGEHATTINGNGVNPALDDILEVSKNIGLDIDTSKSIALEIKDKVEKMLKKYL